MPVKKIVFYVMCALLAIMIVVSGITISKVGALVQGILNPAPPAEPTASVTDSTGSTDSTTDSIGSTDNTQTNATEPSKSVAPTDGSTKTEHQHSYSAYESSPATCIEEGHTLYKCACGDIETRDVVPALGHSYGAGQVISSCTEESYTKYECSRCGHVDKRNITPASGHKLDLIEEFPATCEDKAYTVRKCTNLNCDYSETDFVGEPLGHSFTKVLETVNVTCTTDGYTLCSCINSGCTAEPVKTQIVTAKGHDLDQWKPANNGMQTKCTTPGCSFTIHSSQLQITKEYRSQEGNHYVIEIGTGTGVNDLRQLYDYNIVDNRDKDEQKAHALTYRLDVVLGLVVEYKDASGAPQQVALGFVSDSLTIPSTTAPTPNESTGAASLSPNETEKG